MTLRKIAGTVTANRQVEGGGFVVRRPFPTAQVDHIDPFLLIDEMGPVDYAPGAAIGAPDHPHRGFETVTYIMTGEMEHRDSNGGHGVIANGAVQWMTAGAGVVHSEMPTERMMREGGRMHGFQLWINLPAAKKMIPPHYQGYEAHEIPQADLPNGGKLRVIAGRVGGVDGVVSTEIPASYAHITLAPNETFEWEPDEGLTALVHVFVNSATVNGVEAPEGTLVAGERSAGTMQLTAGPDGVDALLLAGQPLHEPVSRYGPFVMNTREEIMKAFEDYEAGRLGRIVATGPGVSRA